MTERQIQVAVARADVLICAVLRWLPVVAILTTALLLALLLVRERMGRVQRRIEGKAPGVNITSEGS